MKREFSAGGIVFNNGQVLLIKVSAIDDESKKYWEFPKGHIDPGESSKEAAVREIKEETEIKSEIISKIGDSKYTFTFNGEKIFKVVIFFLMKYLSGEPKSNDGEIEEAGWFAPEEALKILSFSTDRALLKKALEAKFDIYEK